jgi:hypothetical protein
VYLGNRTGQTGKSPESGELIWSTVPRPRRTPA